VCQVQPYQGDEALDQEPDRDVPVDVVAELMRQHGLDLVVIKIFQQGIAEDNS
jgi:hypothetical protein